MKNLNIWEFKYVFESLNLLQTPVNTFFYLYVFLYVSLIKKHDKTLPNNQFNALFKALKYSLGRL